MDLNRLRYFKVVAETVNIRKASELLHVTSSALSKAVKQLELDLGMQLVTPEGRGIAITEDGRLAYDLACRLLSQYEEFREALADRRASERPVRIGSYSVFTTYFLGQFLVDEDLPGRIAVHQLGPGEIEAALVEGRIDVGLTYLPVPHPRLKYLQAAKTTMGIYKRKGAFAGKDFHEIPACAPASTLLGTTVPVRGIDAWPAEAFARTVKYEVDGLESALEICRQGLASGYFPDMIIRLHNKQVRSALTLEAIPLPKGLKPQALTIYLVRRKSDQEDGVVRKLAKAVRMACRGSD